MLKFIAISKTLYLLTTGGSNNVGILVYNRALFLFGFFCDDKGTAAEILSYPQRFRCRDTHLPAS